MTSALSLGFGATADALGQGPNSFEARDSCSLAAAASAAAFAASAAANASWATASLGLKSLSSCKRYPMVSNPTNTCWDARLDGSSTAYRCLISLGCSQARMLYISKPS